MAMSQGVGVGSIVIGISLLVLTLISIICGGVAIGKMSSPAAVSIGFWGIYVSEHSILLNSSIYTRGKPNDYNLNLGLLIVL